MAASQRSPFNWHLPSDTGVSQMNRMSRTPTEQAVTPYREPQSKSPGNRSPYSFDPTYFMPSPNGTHSTRKTVMQEADWDPSSTQRSSWKQRGAIALFSGLAVAAWLYYDSPPLIREDKTQDSDVSEPTVSHKTVLKCSVATLIAVLLAETVYNNMISKSYDPYDD